MNIKRCQVCNAEFSGRRDSKTCSSRCRKRLHLSRKRILQSVQHVEEAAGLTLHQIERQAEKFFPQASNQEGFVEVPTIGSAPLTPVAPSSPVPSPPTSVTPPISQQPADVPAQATFTPVGLPPAESLDAPSAYEQPQTVSAPSITSSAFPQPQSQPTIQTPGAMFSPVVAVAPEAIAANPLPATGDTPANPEANTPTVSNHRVSHLGFPAGARFALAGVLVITVVAVGTYLLGNQSAQNQNKSSATATQSVSNSSSLSGSGLSSLSFNLPTSISGNSNSALSVQNVAGDSVLIVDTNTKKVGINKTPSTDGADLQIAGGLSVDNGATSLSNSGLTINNTLICTTGGCSTLAAQAATGRVFAGDADTLAGQGPSFYTNASNISSGVLDPSRIANGSLAYVKLNLAGSVTNSDLAGSISDAKLNQITSANKVADSALSNNVTLNNANNTLSGANIFTGANTVKTDSTGALTIQNASGLNTLLSADTTTSRIAINQASANYTLDVNGDINVASGGSFKISGTDICTSSGCTAASGSGSYIQNNTSVQSANYAIQSANAGYVGAIIKGAASQTADLLQVKDSVNNTLVSIAANGAFTLQTPTDTTTAFQILNHNATSHLIVADTVNAKVAIALPSATYTLDVGGDINSSTGLRVGGTLVCPTSAGCTAAAGSGSYVQNGTTLQSANFAIQSVANTSVAALIRGASGQSADLLDLVSGDLGTNVLGVSYNGNITAPGTYNTNTFTSNALTFGNASAATISAASAQNLALRSGDTSHYVILQGSGGNVGIGTATPTNGQLDVENFGNGVGIYASGNGTAIHGDSGSSYGIQGTSLASVGGYFSSTAGYALVTGTGNVGIGTNSPGTKLEVSGTTTLHPNVVITDAPEGGIYQTVLSLQSTQIPRLQFASNGATPYAEINSYANGGYGLDVATITGLPLLLSTNNTEKVRINVSAGKDVVSIADSGAQNSGITIGGDTNLYRLSSNSLKSDGGLTLGSGITAGGNSEIDGNLNLFDSASTVGAGKSISFVSNTGGSNTVKGAISINALQAGTQKGIFALNVNDDAGSVKVLDVQPSGTTGSSDTVLNLYTHLGSNNIQLSTASSKITLGTDTNLYRSTTSTLKTDGNFITAGNQTVSGSTTLNGTVLAQNTTDSANAFAINNSGGTALLAADTSNMQLTTGNLQSTGAISLQNGQGAGIQLRTISYSGGLTESNVITDSSPFLSNSIPLARASMMQGDGRQSPDSSTGIWEGTTNMIANGGFETNTTGWILRDAGTTTRDTTVSKFGSASGRHDFPANGSPAEAISYNVASYSVGLPYTFSYWIKGTPGAQIYSDLVFSNSGGATITNNYSSTTTLTGNWQRVSVTATAPANTVGGDVEFWNNGGASGGTFYVDGIQLEQKAFATPYVETNGGTASRSNAQVQIPSSVGISPSQGWVALRVRLPYASNSTPTDAMLFHFRTVSDELYAHVSGGTFGILRDVGGTGTPANISLSTPADSLHTVVAKWTSTTVAISVDGSAFTSVANSNVPASLTSFYIGSANGGNYADADYQWFTTGSGTLSNADAAGLYKLGNSDPTLTAINTIDGAAAPTFAWDGEGTQYSSTTASLVNQSTVAIDDVNLTHTGSGSLAIQGGVNSTTAFQVQNASGNIILAVDTTNSKITIGNGTYTANLYVYNNTGNAAYATLTTDYGLNINLRLSTTSINAITNPAAGMIVFNTTLGQYEYNAGSEGTPNWIPFSQHPPTCTQATWSTICDVNNYQGKVAVLADTYGGLTFSWAMQYDSNNTYACTGWSSTYKWVPVNCQNGSTPTPAPARIPYVSNASSASSTSVQVPVAGVWAGAVEANALQFSGNQTCLQFGPNSSNALPAGYSQTCGPVGAGGSKLYGATSNTNFTLTPAGTSLYGWMQVNRVDTAAPDILLDGNLFVRPTAIQ